MRINLGTYENQEEIKSLIKNNKSLSEVDYRTGLILSNVNEISVNWALSNENGIGQVIYNILLAADNKRVESLKSLNSYQSIANSRECISVILNSQFVVDQISKNETFLRELLKSQIACTEIMKSDSSIKTIMSKPEAVSLFSSTFNREFMFESPTFIETIFLNSEITSYMYKNKKRLPDNSKNPIKGKFLILQMGNKYHSSSSTRNPADSNYRVIKMQNGSYVNVNESENYSFRKRFEFHKYQYQYCVEISNRSTGGSDYLENWIDYYDITQ